MSAHFTPLAQALKARVISTAGHDTAIFQPLGRTGAPPVPSSASANAPPPHTAANIELKRDGDRISQIRITCRCGDLIEIDCDY